MKSRTYYTTSRLVRIDRRGTAQAFRVYFAKKGMDREPNVWRKTK
jgi:hypothetical protein